MKQYKIILYTDNTQPVKLTDINMYNLLTNITFSKL